MITGLVFCWLIYFSGFSQTLSIPDIMQKYTRSVSLDRHYVSFDSLRIDSIDLYDESIGFFNKYPHRAARLYRGDSVVQKAIYNDLGLLAYFLIDERDYELEIKMALDGLSVARMLFHRKDLDQPKQIYEYSHHGVLKGEYVQVNDTCENFIRYYYDLVERFRPHTREQTGAIQSMGCLCNGEFQGEITHYAIDGKIQGRHNYRNGQAHGTSMQYNTDGSLMVERWYENGLLKWLISHSEDRIVYTLYNDRMQVEKSLTLDKKAGDIDSK